MVLKVKCVWSLGYFIWFIMNNQLKLPLQNLKDLFKSVENNWLADSSLLVWPQWWSFADVSQQGLYFRKKSVKKWKNFDLTFTDVHMDRQKVPKSDFQSQFSMSKNVRIFLKKNFIEEYQFRSIFIVKTMFCWLQF